MTRVVSQLVALVLGAAIAVLAWSEERWLQLPGGTVGEFARSEAPFYLYSSPGAMSESQMVPAVRKGTPVRVYHTTADREWYRIEWRENGASAPFVGWVKRQSLVVGRTRGEADTAPASAALPPEIEAMRAEREAQRAALDRIREKTEALRRAENQRVQAEREQAQRARAAEAERQHRELVEEVDAIVFWFRVRIGAKAALPWLAALYGAFCLLPLVSLYRMYIESLFLRPAARTHPILIGSSALCFSGAVWILSRGEIESDPETLLILGLFGLFFWFYIPGLLAQVLIFLHSLVVPHPLEATFRRMLHGENISREEAVKVAEALYNARRDGIPADWRVRSHLWRLERLAKLMGREKAFMDMMSEYILNQHETGWRQRR